MKSFLIGVLLIAVMPCAGQSPVQKWSKSSQRVLSKSKFAFNYNLVRDLQPGYFIEAPKRFYFKSNIGQAPAYTRAEILYRPYASQGSGFIQSFISGVAMGLSTVNNYNTGSPGDTGNSWPSFILGTGLGIFMGTRQ